MFTIEYVKNIKIGEEENPIVLLPRPSHCFYNNTSQHLWSAYCRIDFIPRFYQDNSRCGGFFSPSYPGRIWRSDELNSLTNITGTVNGRGRMGEPVFLALSILPVVYIFWYPARSTQGQRRSIFLFVCHFVTVVLTARCRAVVRWYCSTRSVFSECGTCKYCPPYC